MERAVFLDHLADQPMSTPQLKWTPHPIVDGDPNTRPLTREEICTWLARPNGPELVLKYWELHEERIKEAERDPLEHGFELPFWKDFRNFLANRDELYALGGNGPGKTELGGKLVVEMLRKQRSMKVLCVAQSENASKQLQQPAVYKYLPLVLREMCEKGGPRRRDTIKNITWSQKGGFTEGTFVMPNRSQCWFKTVEQYERDKTSFEGPEYDFVWIDEPAPISLVDTLSYRVGKRRGKFLFTFTAVLGFDAVCMRILTGARLLKSLPMNFDWQRGGPNQDIVIPELNPLEQQIKGVPVGHMPYMMQPLNPRQGVIFLWTHWNLFLPRDQENPAIPALFTKCRGKSKATVRTRLFGWAERVSGCQFPMFDANVHIIDPEKVPLEGTDYNAADPATARSYFLLWARVDPMGRIFVFDESPTYEEGCWVDDDGQAGDGMRMYAGKGSNWYKAHIRAREAGHPRPPDREASEPLSRKGDPRAFATEAAAKDGGTSLFDLFKAEGEEPGTEPMFFRAAKVRQTILLDLEKVNDLLSYDEDKPINIENEPRLYISRRCQNLIRSMLNWSPDQGSDSPWKDPIDTLRYLLDEPLYYFDPNVPEVVGGTGW